MGYMGGERRRYVVVVTGEEMFCVVLNGMLREKTRRNLPELNPREIPSELRMERVSERVREPALNSLLARCVLPSTRLWS